VKGKFKPGDVVRLKSGDGPNMTVEQWTTARNGWVCIWFTADKEGKPMPHRHVFSEDTLELVKEKP
jgi:uncharacterized protein YodC (DUF2158 family)